MKHIFRAHLLLSTSPSPIPAAVEDADILEGYLEDASRLHGHASSLYRPSTEAEAAAILEHLNRQGISVTVVACQTSTTGSSVPMGGAILSLEKLSSLIEINESRMSATAQAGILLGDFQRAIEEKGLFYPPDPTSRNESTLGASVACNASGARTFKYGPTRPYVRRLRVILADGSVLELTRGQYSAAPDGSFALRTVEGASRTFLAPSYPRPRVKHAAGYHSSAAADPPLDLIDLFVGSEGTLGLITEVEVRLVPLPEKVVSILATWPDEASALRFVQKARAGRRSRPPDADSSSATGDDSFSVDGDDSSSADGDEASSARGDEASSARGDEASSARGDEASSARGDVASSATGDEASSATGDVASSARGDEASSARGDEASSARGDVASSARGDEASSARGDDSSSARGDAEGIDPRCLEWLDSNSLRLIELAHPDHAFPSARAAVFFEQECTSETEDLLLELWYDLLVETEALVEEENGVIVADSSARQELLYELRHAVPAGVNEIAARNGMPKLGTDLAVPDEALEDMMRIYHEGVRDVPRAIGPRGCLELMVDLVRGQKEKHELKRIVTQLEHLSAGAEDYMEAALAILEEGLFSEAVKTDEVALHDPERLQRRIDGLWKRLELPTSFEYATFGHIGDNHLHVNLLPQSPDGLRAAKTLYAAFTDTAIALGGTVSAEHGIGKNKRAALKRLLGANAIEEMKRVKEAFDPKGILGQGNLF